MDTSALPKNLEANFFSKEQETSNLLINQYLQLNLQYLARQAQLQEQKNTVEQDPLESTPTKQPKKR